MNWFRRRQKRQSILATLQQIQAGTAAIAASTSDAANEAHRLTMELLTLSQELTHRDLEALDAGQEADAVNIRVLREMQQVGTAGSAAHDAQQNFGELLAAIEDCRPSQADTRSTDESITR